MVLVMRASSARISHGPAWLGPTGADLFEAILSKAIVCGADLSGANLYQADMALVHGDKNTLLRDSIAVRVRLKPLYSDKVQNLD